MALDYLTIEVVSIRVQHQEPINSSGCENVRKQSGPRIIDQQHLISEAS